MNNKMTHEIEKAVITLIDEQINKQIDEQIKAKTAQQTRHINRLENALVQLAETQSETQKHLSNQLYTLTNTVNELTNVVKIMQSDIHTMISNSLEERYLKHASAYLGRVLHEAKGFKPYMMENQLRDKLSEADYEDLLLVDLLVGGIPKNHKDTYVLLTLEISVVVNRQDVERAIRRAEIMRRAGFRGIPTVAGESLTQDAKILAIAQNVVVLTNEKIDHWNEALVRTLTATANFQHNISSTTHLKPMKQNNLKSFFGR